MIQCRFEDNGIASLRHVTLSAIILHEQQKGKVLLAKRASFLKNGGLWCLPGGYLDRDETTEEGIRREVFEETGYRVKPLHLVRLIDLPSRPKEDRQNVEFSYVVKAIHKEKSMDKETTEIQWFDFDEIPGESEWAYDHRDTFLWYRKWLDEQFNLPVLNNDIL